MSIGLCLLAGNIIWGTRPGIPDAATQCDKAHQGQQPVPQGGFEQMREEAKEIPVQSRAGVVHFVGELFPIQAHPYRVVKGGDSLRQIRQSSARLPVAKPNGQSKE